MEKVTKLLLYSERDHPVLAAVDNSTTKSTMEQQTDVKERTPPKKKLKLEDIQVQVEDDSGEDDSVNKQWLYSVQSKVKLNTCDRLAIVDGERLCDKHINYAQGLLKLKFSDIQGLECVLLQDRLRFDYQKPTVQILHVRGDHWVVLLNLQCEKSTVFIYDTVYTDIDEQTRCLVDLMFDGKVQINVNCIQKQLGSTDCGVFVITIATSLLWGCYPVMLQQSSLRTHFIYCLESNYFVPFPST